MLLILRHIKDAHQKNILQMIVNFNNFIEVAKYLFDLVSVDLVSLYVVQIGLLYLFIYYME